MKAIIATLFLFCRLKESPVHTINCFARENSPKYVTDPTLPTLTPPSIDPHICMAVLSPKHLMFLTFASRLKCMLSCQWSPLYVGIVVGVVMDTLPLVAKLKIVKFHYNVFLWKVVLVKISCCTVLSQTLDYHVLPPFTTSLCFPSIQTPQNSA